MRAVLLVLPRRRQKAVAIIWAAVMLPFLLSIIGLAIDGSIVFDERRDLQNIADGAARAGAMEVDQQVYRQTAGASVVLDATKAEHTAADYVASQGAGLQPAISVEPQRVVVQVSRQVNTSFLRLAGIDSVKIGATAPAEVRYGIDKSNRP